ncbi:MAG: DUF3108 domain-containing protein [Syntrophales bacterium]
MRVYRTAAESVLLFLLLILLFHSSSPGAGARMLSGKPPFSPGETLTYEGRWGPIPAGEVSLEVLPGERLGGEEASHFAMTTRTNAAVDLLYKIRERQESYVDARMTRSLLYKKRTEGKHPRDVVVNFDWDRGEAVRSNFGEKSPPIRILPGSFDPLALLYILRLQELKENSVIELPVTDGDTNYRVKVTVGGRDVLDIRGKQYHAFEVVPDMERLEGVVKKSDNPEMRVWYSADERKIPLRIRSKVGIVTFDFELVSLAP